MKYIKYFLFFIIFIPNIVFANSYMLNDMFQVNNSTAEPYSFTINANSNVNREFKVEYVYNHGAGANWNMPGNYFFVSIVSSQKLEIKRTNNYGVYCGASCFDNEVYLLEKSSTGGYEYLFYFTARKWNESLGTQIDIYEIDDLFTFYNKGSSSATVYIYGAYTNDDNMIPEFISNADVSNYITIMGENIEYQLTSNCSNLLNVTTNSYSGSGMTITKNSDGSWILNGTNNSGGTYFLRLSDNFILPAGTYTLSNGNSDVSNNNGAIFYDDNSNFDRVNVSTKTFTSSVTIKPYIKWSAGVTLNNFKIFPMIYEGNEKKIYCQYNSTVNKIDETTNAINETNDSINNLNDNLVSNDIDTPISEFSDMEDMIASNGVITNLIALPITLYTSLLNNINGTCTEYNFGSLFNNDIKFQCINLGTILGSTLWGVIDVLFSGFTIYAIAKKMIKVFQNFSGLQEGDVIDD